MTKNRGVLYIAFNDNFIKEALLSAESVKKHCPDLDVTFFSDRMVDSEFVDNCKVISVNHIRAKVDYVDQTPYDETIFLDTDTIIDHDITEMFEILDNFDFAIAHDGARRRDNICAKIPEYANIPYAFSEVNPGVMVFKRNEKVLHFFQSWREIFYKYFNRWPYEQPTFRVALWNSSMKYYILPPEYNARSIHTRAKQDKFKHEFGQAHLKPRIYHMHVDTRINQGIYEVESVETALKYCKENHMKF